MLSDVEMEDAAPVVMDDEEQILDMVSHLLTRIGYGMPLGGDLEYADHVTIGLSLDNRRAMD